MVQNQRLRIIKPAISWPANSWRSRSGSLDTQVRRKWNEVGIFRLLVKGVKKLYGHQFQSVEDQGLRQNGARHTANGGHPTVRTRSWSRSKQKIYHSRYDDQQSGSSCLTSTSDARTYDVVCQRRCILSIETINVTSKDPSPSRSLGLQQIGASQRLLSLALSLEKNLSVILPSGSRQCASISGYPYADRNTKDVRQGRIAEP